MVQNISFVSNSDARDALLKWWTELENSKGERTELRHCHNSMEIAFCPAFHRLRWSLKPFGSVYPESLAIVAGVLSHVKTRDEREHFGAQMATRKKVGENAIVSDLRFRRILKIPTNRELYEPLIRIIKMLDSTVNIPDLANSIYWWNESTRKTWAFDYYEKAPNKK